MNINCHIFVPKITPLQKINRIKHFGKDKLTLHIIGKDFDECLKLSLHFCNQNNMNFIHPFDDIDIISGQGTIGLEIYHQFKTYKDTLHHDYNTIDYIFEDYDKGIFENKFIFETDKNVASSCGCGISFTPKN